MGLKPYKLLAANNEAQEVCIYAATVKAKHMSVSR